MSQDRKGWKLWVAAGVVAALALLAASFFDDDAYEDAVRAQLSYPAEASFDDIRHFPNGAVCGSVISPTGRQRFVVTPSGAVALDNPAATDASLLAQAARSFCR